MMTSDIVKRLVFLDSDVYERVRDIAKLNKRSAVQQMSAFIEEAVAQFEAQQSEQEAQKAKRCEP